MKITLSLSALGWAFLSLLCFTTWLNFFSWCCKVDCSWCQCSHLAVSGLIEKLCSIGSDSFIMIDDKLEYCISGKASRKRLQINLNKLVGCNYEACNRGNSLERQSRGTLTNRCNHKNIFCILSHRHSLFLETLVLYLLLNHLYKMQCTHFEKTL